MIFVNKDVVKFLRKRYKMSQREFAHAVNCSFSLIALIEVGKRNITMSFTDKLKSSFHLTDDQLNAIATFIEETGKGVPPFM